MHGDRKPFFGGVVPCATLLIRNGRDERLPRDIKTSALTHTPVTVYREMLMQIARDYAGLPDPRTLTMAEIRFFYEGLRPELRRHTDPNKSKAPTPPRRR